MDDLLAHVDAMGLHVKFRDLGRRHGEIHSGGLIVINDRRPVRAMRITLAHEVGHAVHNHDWTAARHDVQRDERQANTFAARLLVSPEAYRDAEAEVGTEARHLARHLGVTSDLIELWRESWQQEIAARSHLRLA